MSSADQSPLGKASAYVDQYDASLLFPLPRAGKRAEIGISGRPPFMGADLWTAFELSWLNERGKPQVALAHITVPCETPNIIESKSFKLYLNSFNNTRFSDVEAVQPVVKRITGSQHKDWYLALAILTQAFAHLITVDARQHDVKHDQIVVPRAG